MSLFVIDLTYVADLKRVDALIEGHRSFLKAHYETGCFLVSGPKSPRSGGVILARAADLAEIEKIIEEDPFKTGDVAHYSVTEFTPTMSMHGFPV